MKSIPGFSPSSGAEPRDRCAGWDNPLRAQAKHEPFSRLDDTAPLANCGDTPGLATPRDALRRGPDELERLYAALGLATPASCPRTFKLLDSSTRKISQKVIEEAGEVALEAVKHHASGVVRESADLLYHLVVLWRRAGIEPVEIWEEMRARADAFGIAEKLPKTLGGKSTVADANR
jgi:phosphoribosyl-ATP pyrophosphohydrolase